MKYSLAQYEQAVTARTLKVIPDCVIIKNPRCGSCSRVDEAATGVRRQSFMLPLEGRSKRQ
jgi:hypothetical protein